MAVIPMADADKDHVNWEFVDRSNYKGGFELAVNHDEVMISFPQMIQVYRCMGVKYFASWGKMFGRTCNLAK